MDEKLIAHFWSQVDKLGPVPAHCAELGPCWIWKGSAPKSPKPGKGHGLFTWWRKDIAKTKTICAHRFSWLVTNGPIPTGALVLHECDVCACVNPSHLFIGTHQDNVDDMFAKGRARKAKGSENAAALLNETQVVRMREMSASGVRLTELASVFSISYAAVYDVVRRRSWKHVTP